MESEIEFIQRHCRPCAWALLTWPVCSLCLKSCRGSAISAVGPLSARCASSSILIVLTLQHRRLSWDQWLGSEIRPQKISG